MRRSIIGQKVLHYFIAFVWLVNGLFFKVLNLVPRHQQIVARILGDEHAFVLTKVIGVLEVLMVVWILSGIKRRLNMLAQIALIASMNIMECILAPDLLLFGRFNALFALILITSILLNEFLINKNSSQLV